jgi:hypothetical protein
MRVSTLALLVLLSCHSASPSMEARITVSARDATELYGFKGVAVHLACASIEPVTVTTDDHGVANFRAPRGTTCTVDVTYAPWSAERFSQTFVAADRAVSFMFVSKVAYLTEPPMRFEPPMKAVRVYPDRQAQ